MNKIFILVIFLFTFVTVLKSDDKFEDVVPGLKLSYPRDHANHPRYPIEWWYVTGHLKDKTSQQYDLGFQITFFRIGIKRTVELSKWQSDSLIIRHSAFTDLKNKRYCSLEKLQRSFLSLSGSKDDQLNVWLGDSFIKMEQNSNIIISFSCEDKKFNLHLNPLKPLVLHGENGFVKKGANIGDASYYSSFTRLKVSGAVKDSNNLSRAITGLAWYDHEIISSKVSSDDVGWDWFALQMSDNTELMLYQLRDNKGNNSKFSRAVLISPNGTKSEFKSDQCSLRADQIWVSPKSGIKYPIEWQINCKNDQHELSYLVKATINDQEFSAGGATRKRYWEGSVKVSGLKNHLPLSGVGYLEMVQRTN